MTRYQWRQATGRMLLGFASVLALITLAVLAGLAPEHDPVTVPFPDDYMVYLEAPD